MFGVTFGEMDKNVEGIITHIGLPPCYPGQLQSDWEKTKPGDIPSSSWPLDFFIQKIQPSL